MPDNEMKPVLSPSVELWRPYGPAARAAAAIMANVAAGFKEALARAARHEARDEGVLQEPRPGVAAGPRPCAEALPPKRRDAQARGEVQVTARTGLRIEACRHIFRRLSVPYGN